MTFASTQKMMNKNSLKTLKLVILAKIWVKIETPTQAQHLSDCHHKPCRNYLKTVGLRTFTIDHKPCGHAQ